jgi:septal ring factor EnvC (AmiA/AmiB activator)
LSPEESSTKCKKRPKSKQPNLLHSQRLLRSTADEIEKNEADLAQSKSRHDAPEKDSESANATLAAVIHLLRATADEIEKDSESAKSALAAVTHLLGQSKSRGDALEKELESTNSALAAITHLLAESKSRGDALEKELERAKSIITTVRPYPE